MASAVTGGLGSLPNQTLAVKQWSNIEHVFLCWQLHLTEAEACGNADVRRGNWSLSDLSPDQSQNQGLCLGFGSAVRRTALGTEGLPCLSAVDYWRCHRNESVYRVDEGFDARWRAWILMRLGHKQWWYGWERVIMQCVHSALKGKKVLLLRRSVSLISGFGVITVNCSALPSLSAETSPVVYHLLSIFVLFFIENI